MARLVMKAEEVVWQWKIEFHNLVYFPKKGSYIFYSALVNFYAFFYWEMPCSYVFHPGKIMQGGGYSPPIPYVYGSDFVGTAVCSQNLCGHNCSPKFCGNRLPSIIPHPVIGCHTMSKQIWAEWQLDSLYSTGSFGC